MCVAVKWCQWFCVLLSIAFFILPNFNDGFKLKDITSPEESKPPKKEFLPFKKITKVVHVDEDGNEEVVDFKFEKVHKADFPKSQAVFKTIAEEKEKEEDIVVEEASEKLAWSFSSVLGIFGYGDQPKPETDSNGIIDFLKSLKNDTKLEKAKEPVSTPSTSTNWISYLNRWPFNLFFPFVKTDTSTSGQTSNGYDDGGQYKKAEPLSQEDFESLLHRLPNFVINPSEAEDIECKNQLHIFHRQLRGHKMWTLQMMDASAKIPSGVLRGNVNQFGDFDLCTHIKTVVKITTDQSIRIKGKYCLAHIEVSPKNDELKVPLYMAQGRGLWNSHLDNPSHFVPRYTIVKWGVCVPNSCSSTDILRMLESSVRPYNNTGVNFNIQVQEEDCYIRKNLRIVNLVLNNWKIALTIGIFALLTSVVFGATIFDNWSVIREYASRFLKDTEKGKQDTTATESDKTADQNEEHTEYHDEEKTKKSILIDIILSFSAKRSLIQLFSTESTTIKALPVLRVICTALLYVSLKFLLIGHLPITNRDKLIKTLDQPLSVVIRSPLIYFDIILLISGLLSSYQMSQEIKKKSSIAVIKRITGNFLRYLPTLYVVLLFQTWILPHIGSGPLWGTLVGQNARICGQNMWRNFFAVQNVIDFEKTCSPMTTQLAVEMQLFLLAPLLVWLYNSNGDVGFMVYGAINAISVAARFSRTNINSLSSTFFHGMNVSKFYRTANMSFASPLNRATAYLIGIGIGLLLQSKYEKPNFPKGVSIAGWTAAMWCIVWCFWYPSHNMSSDFIYDPGEAAAYASWAPLLLSLAIGWMIFMTHTIELPFVVESFLLSKPIILLSKISFPIQLVTYTTILFSTAEHKETIRFHTSDLVNFKEIFVIIVLSLVLAVLVDIPFRNLRKLLHSTIPALSTTDEELEDDMEQEKSTTGDHPEEENLNKEEEAIENIWESEAEKDDTTYKTNEVFNRHGSSSPPRVWNKPDSSLENWRTESDLETETTQSIETKNTSPDEEGAEDEEEIAEEEEIGEEEEIAEEDEIIRRPVSPEPLFRRRHWDVDED